MLAFAYAECGLSVEKFFELSFYEWSLEIHKVLTRRERDHTVWEGHASLHREVMALLANVNRDSKTKPTPYKGSDFMKLSYDTDEEAKNKRMTPEEVDAKFPKLLKAKNG